MMMIMNGDNNDNYEHISFGNSLAKTYYNHPELLQREGKQKK